MGTGGLMSLIRYGCYQDIILFREFEEQPDFYFTLQLYIMVFKQGYKTDFNEKHLEFTIQQFERLFHKNELQKDKTILDQVKFCPELYDYFVSKGVA